MKHKEKVKLAIRMRTHKELVGRVSIWLTEVWTRRKIAIYKRVEKQHREAHERALARKKAKEEKENDR